MEDNNKINGLQEQIKNYEQLIYDEEIWINQEMRKIGEVTYSYTNIDQKTQEALTLNGKQININTTLFCSLGGLDLQYFNNLKDEEKEKSILEANYTLIKKIGDKKQQIFETIKSLKELQNSKNISEENSIIIDIFINSLIEKDKLLDYCSNGIPYELEKAGIESNLHQTEKDQINQKQKNIDKEIFGGEIQDNQEEVIKCYEYLLGKYKENKSNLNKQEKERYDYFLSKVREKIPKNYTYSKKEELPNQLDQYEDIKINNTDYILGFNLFIEALNKLKHVAKKDPYAKSISDGPLGVLFPTTKKFDYITLKRFLKLNAHEIETHNITDHNNKQLIGNIIGAGSTIKDEGLAILMELFLQHGDNICKIDKKTGKKIIDIEKLPVNNTFSYLLMGELLNSDELLEFLKLNEKIEPDIIEINSRYDRLKRSNDEGVQHKDTSYIRGLFKAVELNNKYILSNGNEGVCIEDMFLGKAGFDELKMYKRLKEIKEDNGEKVDIVMPIFSSDTILFSIEQLLENKKVTKQEFLKYLQKKYSLFDFSQEKIDEVSRSTRENILGVLHIAMKNISNHNLSKIPEKGNTIKHIKTILNNTHNPTIKRRKNRMSEERRKAS